MTESNSLRNAWSSTTFAGPPQPPQGTPHASYSSLVPPLGVLCKAGLVCFALLCFVFLATVTKTTWGIGVTCPRIIGHLLCLWEREGRFRDIFFPLIYQSIKKKKKKTKRKKTRKGFIRNKVCCSKQAAFIQGLSKTFQCAHCNADANQRIKGIQQLDKEGLMPTSVPLATIIGIKHSVCLFFPLPGTSQTKWRFL